MKKPISIKLDDSLWVHIKNKTNKSAYISELIKQDIQAQQTKPIVQAVKDELMRNESFFSELSQRLGKPLNIASESEPQVFVPRPPDPTTGYPCCQKQKPCKHWGWDDVELFWKNSLTQQTKEG